MAENDLGLKELYGVKLKATYNMDINGIHYNEGEVITEFETIQMANFGEVRSYITARGGYENQTRVVWDATKEVKFHFSKGIMNKLQFAIIQNLKIVEPKQDNYLILTEVEHLESNNEGNITTKYSIESHCSVRDKQGYPILFTQVGTNKIHINQQYQEVIVSYDFKYINSVQEYIMGRRFENGFFELEARTRVKDDITGQTHTGIIKIPKLKLTGDLAMRLGDQASPFLGSFSAIGYPVGSRENKKVMEIYFLSDDIDSDI